MNITIAGAGAVGSYLAKMLSNERHNICLLDELTASLSNLASSLDIMTVTGSPTSLQSLKEARCHKANLFIGVTPNESENLLSCMLAKQLGASKTIARVNKQEYLKEANRAKLKELGVDEIVFPEYLATDEIIQIIHNTGAREMFVFGEGKIILLALRIRGYSKVLGKQVEEVSAKYPEFHIGAIVRGEKTHLADSPLTIERKDIVFLFTYPENMNQVQNLFGREDFSIKNIMIVGGSRIGFRLAQRLEKNYHIHLVESNHQKSEHIAEICHQTLVFEGDGSQTEFLKESGIKDMDAIIATTDNSETNLLISLIAKNSGVRKSIAEIYHDEYYSVANALDIGTIINKKLIAASYIYRFTMSGEVPTMKYLNASGAEVFEFVVKEGSKIVGKPITFLNRAGCLLVGGMIRNGRGILPLPNETPTIEVDDKVIVFALPVAVSYLNKIFK